MPRSVPALMRVASGSPRCPHFLPRACRPDRFSTQHTRSCALRAPRRSAGASPRPRYDAVAAAAFDAGQASRRNVGAPTDHDRIGSHKSAASIYQRHQAVTHRVFSRPLAASAPNAASAACHYPFPADRPTHKKGSDRRHSPRQRTPSFGVSPEFPATRSCRSLDTTRLVLLFSPTNDSRLPKQTRTQPHHPRRVIHPP